MSAVQHPFTAIPPSLRRRLLLQLALILTAGLLLSSAYLWFSAGRDAQAQTLSAGDKLMRQSAVLLQPLLLADDRVSLNYLINELGDQPEVVGISLYDHSSELVARSGEAEGPLELELLLEREQQNLGRMLFWLDPAPAREQRLEQLSLVALLWLGCALVALLALALALNARPPRELAEADSANGAQEEADTFTEAGSADAGLAAPTPNETAARADASDAPEDADTVFGRDAPADEQSDAFAPQDADADASSVTAPQDYPQPMDASEYDEYEDDEADDPNHSAQHRPAKEESGFEGLLDLLRPVKERLMPRFTPSSPQAEDNERHQEPRFIDEELEFDDEPAAEPPRPGKPNPLRERAETQLGLYSLEHELELILEPHEASYLILIDAASGHAEYVDEAERAQLLTQYGQFAHQIAGIYSGDIEPQDNGDVRVWFREPTDDDAHGANALCAAKLFTLLYRGFNQRRIRNFQPVLNLHIALVRGNAGKPALMLEEAQFLTRSTQSNELISHTALTEVPDLKDNLLEQADIRREDEDKVLIHRLSEDYEELLERQASHLISKTG
ncbi:hypothetical protein [Marinobacterium rhizophilum]|uniref:Membrane protein affecting hemolysin expression n=1 Tax=Marinobacterium rhizophilum TaxID=420402 RepID=A0ABY5HE25_9GAMM|nr:hypothetical protein [Marinobacterium rhizophilum]UTW10359.1 hypothetical protein KDW95_13730 [Marinobacterium rhizophilum]